LKIANGNTLSSYTECIMTAPNCDVPNGGDDCVKTTPQIADDFVETPKLIKVEAEIRPDFKELKSIEKQRREILLRVSTILIYVFLPWIIWLLIHFHEQLLYPTPTIRRNFRSGVFYSSGVVLA